MTSSVADVQCCIAGGGPAGMMLGLLLARAGVSVVVLEKHGDFLRDFRGDTLHPSTLDLMDQLGLLDEFLSLPHQEARELFAQIGDSSFAVADFSYVPGRCKFIALIPQWDFLTFLMHQGARYPGFSVSMQAQADGLIEDAGRVVGVRMTTPQGRREVRARLVVGADGRHSTIRAAAGLVVDELGAPMDVLWFRLTRHSSDPSDTKLRLDAGRLFIMINRETVWQCGYVIPKGSLAHIQRAGIEAFRAGVASLAPFTADRLEELRDWDDVKLLTVQVDRLRTWHRPGLLCIGDAAHAMSPVGGVGINLAIQDAVATANELAAPLRDGRATDELLARVQRRREFPTLVTQRFQVLVGDRIVSPVLGTTKALGAPLILKVFNRVRLLRALPAWFIGVGVRPERVRTPELISANPERSKSPN